MRPSDVPRIAVYDCWETLNWAHGSRSAEETRKLLQANKDEVSMELYQMDPVAWELIVLDQERTCPHCATALHLDSAASDEQSDSNFPAYFYFCSTCGFWFGRGTRDIFEGPAWGRGAIARIREEPLTSLTIPNIDLVRHLNSHPTDVTKINPYRAEELVCHILSDALGCEVRHVGGRKDKGVDAFVVVNDKIHSIVQVKWRQNSKKAEAISTVREFAGTLLARGIPRGILVTTANDLSSDAKSEIKEIEGRELVTYGALEMEYRTYADILSMLGLSNRKITDDPCLSLFRSGGYDDRYAFQDAIFTYKRRLSDRE